MSLTPVVSPSVLTPGLYMTVNLLAGTASPGTGTLKVLVMATQSSSGNLTDDTEVRSGGGVESARTAFGAGTLGALAAEIIYDAYPAADMDFNSPAENGAAVTATLDVTLAGTPSANNIIDIDIQGRTFEVTWNAAETADACKTKVINAILQRTNSLSCTASSGGVGIITIDSKVGGPIGNDILVYMNLRDGTTNTETIAGTTFVDSQLATGAGEVDLANSIAAIVGQEYHLILPCLSNADVENVGSANNASKVVAHINANNTGLSPELQQFVCGWTGATLATIQASTVHANSFGNDEVGECIGCVNGRSLPGEWGAAEVAGRIAAESLDPAANRIGEIYTGLYGSRDKISDKPTLAESEAALGNGVSLVSYNAQDAEYLVRAITTHSQDSAGGSDTRLLDVQNVSAAYIVARDIRDNLFLEFPNAKLIEDRLASEDPPPPGTIEERDVKAWCISRLRFWQDRGVIDAASLDTAITGGTLIAQVNATDPTQLDIVLPFEILQPFAKAGVEVQRIPS
jgi:phage tail sheath gpL-like